MLSQEVPVLEACICSVGLTDAEFLVTYNRFPHLSISVENSTTTG